MSNELTDSQRLGISFTVENWMLTEFELMGLDLEVFALSVCMHCRKHSWTVF